MNIYHILCVHSGCFPSGAVTNNAAMNSSVRVCVGACVFIPLEYMPKGGIAGSYANSCLTF